MMISSEKLLKLADFLTISQFKGVVKVLNEDEQAPENHWGQDEQFPVESWQYEVTNGETRLGYWDWVRAIHSGEKVI